MASIFVTGSADGIGRRIVLDLVGGGHRVVLHARNPRRAEDALAAVPGAAGVAMGDLASLAQTRDLAERAAELGPFDAVVHNAGVRIGGPERPVTEDGMEVTFQVNVLAPYMLTALMPRPARLVYLTSSLEGAGVADLTDLQHERRPWDDGRQAYCDSKLYDVVLAFAVARRWPDVISNAVDPGWIRTRMGGDHAPGDPRDGADTPVWLATSDEAAATGSGRYLHGRRERRANPAAYDLAVQDGLLAACARLSGTPLPAR
jgi:NAD(P)-dependent dehydrogenase (short-subunit alcohol dehydrogenase family)